MILTEIILLILVIAFLYSRKEGLNSTSSQTVFTAFLAAIKNKTDYNTFNIQMEKIGITNFKPSIFNNLMIFYNTNKSLNFTQFSKFYPPKESFSPSPTPSVSGPTSGPTVINSCTDAINNVNAVMDENQAAQAKYAVDKANYNFEGKMAEINRIATASQYINLDSNCVEDSGNPVDCSNAGFSAGGCCYSSSSANNSCVLQQQSGGSTGGVYKQTYAPNTVIPRSGMNVSNGCNHNGWCLNKLGGNQTNGVLSPSNFGTSPCTGVSDPQFGFPKTLTPDQQIALQNSVTAQQPTLIQTPVPNFICCTNTVDLTGTTVQAHVTQSNNCGSGANSGPSGSPSPSGSNGSPAPAPAPAPTLVNNSTTTTSSLGLIIGLSLGGFCCCCILILMVILIAKKKKVPSFSGNVTNFPVGY